MKSLDHLCPRDQLLYCVRLLTISGQKFIPVGESQAQFCEELVTSNLLKKLDDSRSYVLTELGDAEIKFAFEEPVQEKSETEENSESEEKESDSKEK